MEFHNKLEDERALKIAITDFLDKISTSQPRQQVCSRCGSSMQSIDATFFLYGTELNWQVSVPVCSCELESLAEERATEA
jgi:hypothetical protein